MIQPLPKPPKVIQDESRLDFVRRKPCLILELQTGAAWRAHLDNCGWFDATTDDRRSEAHHVRKGTQTGLSRKPSASRTIPLCSVAHNEFHAIGHAAFEAKYGLDLAAHLLRINREFEASHPNVAKKRASRPAIGLTVRNCIGCQHNHELLAPSKWQRGRREIRYFCSRRNAYFVWEMK